MHERLRSLAPEAQGVHRALLWTPVVVVACAGVLVLGAIVAGPRGAEGVGSGLGIMVGGLFLLGGYGVAAYRSLLPTAGAILLWGILIEAQAVADAWSVARTWNAWDLLLIVPVVPVQALSAEAAWRAKPGWFWAVWTAIGTAMAVAYPVWMFFGRPGSGDLAVALTLGSLVWGVAANFAFAPIPKFARWAGVAVFGGWALCVVLAYAYPTDLTLRLKAAGIVAAAVVATVAFVSYFLAKPRPAPDIPAQEAA